jgi:hypothetical protein
VVVASLLVPDTEIKPYWLTLDVGVKVAVYVDPLSNLDTVDKEPPVTLISELLNLVVAVLIENVTVAVCPGVNVVIVESIVHVISITTVLIVRSSVSEEENVVVPSLVVPDTEIEPDVLVDAVGVKIAVYVDPLFDVVTFDRLPPTTLINELLKTVVGVLIVNVTVAVCPGVKVVLVESIVQVTVETRVFIVRSSVSEEENVVVPSLVVPDTKI